LQCCSPFFVSEIPFLVGPRLQVAAPNFRQMVQNLRVEEGAAGVPRMRLRTTEPVEARSA